MKTSNPEREPETFIKRFELMEKGNIVGHGNIWKDGFTQLFLTGDTPVPNIRHSSFSFAMGMARCAYPDLTWDWVGANAR